MKNSRHDAPGTRHLLKIGLMGGTFDPIHYGHLVTAEQAYHTFGLDSVIFMPAGTPALKHHPEILPREQRFIMTVIATSNSNHFEVSRLEIDRPGPTYTVDTLMELKDIYKDQAEFYFITGADAILDILAWRDAKKVIMNANIIAATRPGYDLVHFEQVEKKLNIKPKVHFLEVSALAISSTDIRRRVKQKKPIRYLLPDGVYRYIMKKGFYV
ncbi:MAG: nicotinate-nucleotide adenylyltransferase [Actinobacteria bacterium]|nr:MAG: nicotinate-nucleotide adenylyltransferase [Actinomycetota bacterium]